MKNPNGWGSVHKLPGTRRKPWRARITAGWESDESGKSKQLFKTIGYYETREEAMTALAEYNANPYEISTGITFREVYEKWSAEKTKKVSANTVEDYKFSYAVCEPLYNLKFAEIRLTHLQSVIDNSGKNYPSLRKVKSLMSQLYTYAMQHDICQKDYSDYVDIVQYKDKSAPEKHKRFTAEEINILWKNADRSEYIGVVLMLIYCGTRISELLDLRKEDVHLDERYFDVRASKTAAGIRKVPISEKTVPFWEKWMSEPGEYVIHNADDRKMVYHTYIDTYWDKPLTQIGIQDHRPHDTRHTCVSLLAEANVNKTLIQRIVGHKGRDVTDDVYTHFEIKQLVAAINKI